MKNLAHNFKLLYLTYALLLGGIFTAVGQTTGIPYQAYITTNIDVPGESVEVPLANTEILLEFVVRDENGVEEYREHIPVTTDKYGLASTIVGAGYGTPQNGKDFSGIDWNGLKKTLDIGVDLSNTGDFSENGEMPIMYIPGPTGTTIEGVITSSGPPTTANPASPNPGDIYVDETTGDIYTYDGANWIAQPSQLSSGTGDPTTAGVTGAAGDVYVDESTGDVYTFDGANWVSVGGTASGTGDPTTAGVTGTAGDIYVDESTGDIYTYNGTTNAWESQSETLANNGLTVNTDNTVQLGGDLITPTTITADATNTLAVQGLEAPATTDDYDIVTVDNTTGVLKKIPASNLGLQRYVEEYTAADGDIQFAVPQTITNATDLDNIDVYRNGVRIDFTQVNTTTIELDLGALAGCYSGDEIRIVQLQ